MSSAYVIAAPLPLSGVSWGARFLRDEPQSRNNRQIDLDFHLATGDYFATIATMLALIADSLENGMDADTRSRTTALLSELRAHLAALQHTHRITPRK